MGFARIKQFAGIKWCPYKC